MGLVEKGSDVNVEFADAGEEFLASHFYLNSTSWD